MHTTEFCSVLAVVLLIWLSTHDGHPVPDQVDDIYVSLSADVNLTSTRYGPHDQDDLNGYVFYGIKYGNSERFQHSTLNTNFSYLHDPAFPKAGYVCPQKTILLPNQTAPPPLPSSEDCLYLDVYVPSLALRNGPLPVVYWIHGGGFEIGHKVMFNATLLARDTQTVVVVPNYRLNVLGFLSTGDEQARGNFGVGDLKLAFRWMVDNIHKFGGDSQRITVSGQSAGGALTSILMLDEHIRDYVFGAVAWSGSTFAQWTRQRDPRQMADEYAALVGCPNNDSTLLVECLKHKSVSELLKPETEDTLMKLHRFSPVVDGLHLNATATEDVMARSGLNSSRKNVTFVTGYLKEDSTYLHTIMDPDLFVPGKANYTVFKSLIRNYLPAGKSCPRQAETQLWQKVLDRYDIKEGEPEATMRHKFFHATSEILFGYPAVKEALTYADQSTSGQLTHLYLISHDLGFQSFGAFHTMDFVFLFRDHWDSVLPSDLLNDKLTESLRSLMREVAYGELKWRPFGATGNYYNLNQNLTWEHQMDPLHGPDYISFWDSIFGFKCNSVAR